MGPFLKSADIYSSLQLIQTTPPLSLHLHSQLAAQVDIVECTTVEHDAYSIEARLVLTLAYYTVHCNSSKLSSPSPTPPALPTAVVASSGELCKATPIKFPIPHPLALKNICFIKIKNHTISMRIDI